MQSRRYQEFATQSSVARDRNRQIDSGPGRIVMPRSRRSLSPGRGEGSRPHALGEDRRSSSLERRDYGNWDLGGGRRDHMPSRSPSFEVKKGSRYEDGVMDKDLPPSEVEGRYDFFDYMDRYQDIDSGVGIEFGYKHSSSRAMRGEEFDGVRHGMVGQKPSVLEDVGDRGVYRLPVDVGLNSKYDERGGGNFSSASVNLGLGRRRDERVRYPDPFLLDKLSAKEQYGEREKTMFHLRGDPYSSMTAFESKDYIGTSHIKHIASTSSGSSRINYSDSYRAGIPLPAEDSSRSSAKMMEPLAYPGYGERRILDTRRDLEHEIKEDLARYVRDTFSPSRTDSHLNYRPGVRANDEYWYPSDDIYRRMDSSEREEYGRRDLLRPSRIDVTEHVDDTEFSRANMRNRGLWDHRSLEKQTVSNYIGLSRSQVASKQGGQYLDSANAHFEDERKLSRVREMPYLGLSRDSEMSHIRTVDDFKRDAGPESLKERMRSSPEFLYETDMHRLSARTKRMEGEDLGKYDLSNRTLKRKYATDEEVSRHASRSIIPNKWNYSSRRQDHNNRDEEWIDQDLNDPIFSKRGGYAHGLNRRLQRAYDGIDRHIDSTAEDWFPSHDPTEDHSTKSYKSGSKYSKDHPRSGSLNLHSNHSNRKHGFSKWKNVWIRGEDEKEVGIDPGEGEQSDVWVSSGKSEPPEDSEEFKQRVHKFFLIFTKKLNENPGVRKRYEEQGRAGSLFCVVCGRSISKEFTDTQRLATHAFMSHKVGLRAQHLGLHKAICVLLGWNSVVARETVTWYPETLPSADALAQKEDLILWPPVIVIQNIAISNNNSEGQEAEALGDFLRGKGLSSGKIKPGRPANCGIMVVKFLGTFSGLQDAKKLHSYFVNSKRGRKEIAEIASSKRKSKSSNSGAGEMMEDNVNEHVLYGYMGIAEDLDKVDFDTKRKSLIKSKKEIQDLVDAPVKP